jgi:thioredoxin-related protein
MAFIDFKPEQFVPAFLLLLINSSNTLKKFLLVIFLIIQYTFSFSQEENKIHWISFKDAVEKNKTTPKKIFIDVYTGWCGWCKKMDATTFEDKAVVKYMNEKFYAVKLDAETKDTILYKDKSYTYIPDYKSNEIAAYLLQGKMGYPTSVYLDEKMDLIGPVQGYMTNDQLLPVLKYFAEDFYKTVKWEDFLSQTFNKK